jgi:hypothetical protein
MDLIIGKMDLILIKWTWYLRKPIWCWRNMDLIFHCSYFVRELRAGGEKGGREKPFSPPARSSPALIFPPASPPPKNRLLLRLGDACNYFMLINFTNITDQWSMIWSDIT